MSKLKVEMVNEMSKEPQNEPLGAYELSLEQAFEEAVRILNRSFDSDNQPDLAGLKRAVLKKGQRTYKFAKYWTIRDRHTGEENGHQLTLATLSHTKKRGWELEGKHTITLNDKEDNEIQKLVNFLASLSLVSNEGDYILINPRDIDESRFRTLLTAISVSGKRAELLGQILSWVDTDPNATEGLIQLASDYPVRSKSLAAALNYGRYSRALEQFKELVNENHSEHVYQKFLEENFWMFGSEYSELLPIRKIATGIQLDFPLRRTVDGYLEVIEIKTPMNKKPIFNYDRSHDTYYKSSELEQAVAQASKYLRVIDKHSTIIKAETNLITDKVRAKVVIGRDLDEKQLLELRAVNASHNSVEIITFDQVIRIAQRILDILAKEARTIAEDHGN